MSAEERPPAAGRFRLGITAVLIVAITVAAIRLVRAAAWGDGRAPSGPVESILSWLSVLWALPALSCVLGLIGMVLYRERRWSGCRPLPDGCDDAPEVCFRIVSRGQNVKALRRTIDSTRREMVRNPLFPYRIEVVTDRSVPLPPGDDVRGLVVPRFYETATGALFKARALQFALERSDLADGSWIFHLDEESHLTASVVAGIRDAVQEEEASGRYRIGQGVIMYHRHLDDHPFLTLADMVRTGDDLGRFHLQHRLGFTLFGLHGSFILVRNSVEKAVGFDVGPEGSITEDAFWALRQMGAGRRCRWVEGYIVEQSPESIRDFVKQRRRWFAGMVRVVLYAEVQAWIRVPLAFFTAVWSVSWLSMAYTVANVFMGLRTGAVVTVLGDLSLAVYLATYLVGLQLNLRDHGRIDRLRRVRMYFLQIVLLPLFSLLEAAAVLTGMLRPERGFPVVAK